MEFSLYHWSPRFQVESLLFIATGDTTPSRLKPLDTVLTVLTTPATYSYAAVQEAVYYLKSYSLSKHARSVIIPILVGC